MPVKKLSKSKRLSKKLSKKKLNRKTKIQKHKRNKSINGGFSKSKRHSKSKRYLRGGFLNDPSCNLATIKEPGFSLSNLKYGSGSASIGGLNITDSRAIIYNPNCKADTYQAMIP